MKHLPFLDKTVLLSQSSQHLRVATNTAKVEVFGSLKIAKIEEI